MTNIGTKNSAQQLPRSHRPWMLLALCFAAVIPLLYPPIPPLVDLPGHMGRFAVQLAQGTSTPLHRYYAFEWELVGNLGVDLLVIPLSKLLGLEVAVKCIVIAIPALAALGIVAISREVHGRITPTALFALPLAYGYPFIFGFVNYCLSMSMALAAFALWLRMQRANWYWRRALLFLFIAPLLWVAHVAGWATLCLMCAASELVHQYDLRRPWLLSLGSAAFQGLALASPLALMLVWHSKATGASSAGWVPRGGKL